MKSIKHGVNKRGALEISGIFPENLKKLMGVEF